MNNRPLKIKWRDASDASPAERGLPIAAVEVQPRDLSRPVRVTGTVEPRVHIRLASRTSGTVDAVFFEAADPVQTDDLLARLDMSEQQAELERTRALRQEAQLEYRRYADLQEGRMVSATECQRARAALAVLNSEVKLWETRVAFGDIMAPRDGVLTARVRPGFLARLRITVDERSRALAVPSAALNEDGDERSARDQPAHFGS